MNTFSDLWEVAMNSLQTTFDSVLGFLPKLAMASLVLIVGWIIALVIQKATSKLFKKIGLDRLAEKAGIASFLQTSGVSRDLSRVFARILYWAVILITLLPVSDILRLAFFAELINSLVGYLPNIFVALFVIVVGTWAARVLSGMVRGNLTRLGEEYANIVGTGIQVAVLLISFIIALSQLRIDSSILTYLTLIIVGAAAIGIAIAFAIGSRDIIRNVLAGIYINNSFQVGNSVRIDGTDGKIAEIGNLATTIETTDGKKLTFPNVSFMTTGL